MWFFISFILATAGPMPPERLLLIEDIGQPNLERALVYQQLLANLLRDPAVQLVPDGAWPPQLHRSVALQEQADLLAGDARRHLHALDPEAAAISASAARLRYGRVAELSGDLTGLTEALSLSAAAHLLLGHRKEARAALTELYTLEPSFVPDVTLYNRSMQQTAREVAREVLASPKSSVCVQPATEGDFWTEPGARTAVFVDGHFLGFGPQQAKLSMHVRHHLWLVPEHGAPQGRFFCPAQGPLNGPQRAVIGMWPTDGGERSSGNAAFGHVVAASRLPIGEIDPHHPSLASRRIDTVLVLAYSEGALRLTTFDLRSGKRRMCQAAAAVTNLWDVPRIADALAVAPLPLAAVPSTRGP